MNSADLLQCIEIEPQHPATHSIIWLHGLGADGNDFVPIVPELKLSKSANLRFIFPNAPVMPVSINNGYEMRAWYDIYGIAIDSKTDSNGIAESLRHVDRLIAREVARGIATNNIFLAGFSQGAVIALITGLCYAKPLAGIIALSGYLPLAHEVLQKAHEVNRETPVFLGHGTEDTVVPFALGNAVKSVLQDAGYRTTWHHYPMPHSVCAEEISDISQWLQKAMM